MGSHSGLAAGHSTPSWRALSPPRLAVFVIADENRDFHILQLGEAGIAIFILVVGFAGGATAGFDHLLDRHLPSEQGVSFLYGGLSALGALLALPLLFGAFFTTGLCDCA